MGGARVAGRRRAVLVWLAAPSLVAGGTGLLHPQASESRELHDLSGLWRFRVDVHSSGMREGWQVALLWRNPGPPTV